MRTGSSYEEKMTELAVEKELCAECGADVRPDAQFCYNCGGAINTEDGGVSDAWFKEDIANDGEASIDPEIVDSPIGKPSEDLSVAPPVENQDSGSVSKVEKDADSEPGPSPKVKTKNRVKPKPKMKSAASLRKKPKPFPQRREEVIWVERNSSPNVWFILMSILVILLVAGLFVLAMYFK